METIGEASLFGPVARDSSVAYFSNAPSLPGVIMTRAMTLMLLVIFVLSGC